MIAICPEHGTELEHPAERCYRCSAARVSKAQRRARQRSKHLARLSGDDERLNELKRPRTPPKPPPYTGPALLLAEAHFADMRSAGHWPAHLPLPTRLDIT
jgi:hypothetical protein